jgi:hypothetical protein
MAQSEARIWGLDRRDPTADILLSSGGRGTRGGWVPRGRWSAFSFFCHFRIRSMVEGDPIVPQLNALSLDKTEGEERVLGGNHNAK